MAAKLFEQKYITVGTLLAIFSATKRMKRLFILLSSGQGAVWLLPLIVLKIFVGVAAGYAADGLLNAFKKSYVRVSQISSDGKGHTHVCDHGDHDGDCGGEEGAHDTHEDGGRFFCARRRSRSSNALPADGCTTKRGR